MRTVMIAAMTTVVRPLSFKSRYAFGGNTDKLQFDSAYNDSFEVAKEISASLGSRNIILNFVMTSEGRSVFIPACVGVAVFVGMHVFFASGPVHVYQGWWLNSSRSVQLTMGTIFVAAVGVLLPFGAPLRGAVAMWAGTFLAMPFVLATVPGEHNLWPIVVVLGGILTGISVLLGMVVAMGIGAIFRRPSGR
jgi:hypothetical protein